MEVISIDFILKIQMIIFKYWQQEHQQFIKIQTILLLIISIIDEIKQIFS